MAACGSRAALDTCWIFSDGSIDTSIYQAALRFAQFLSRSSAKDFMP
jgi:hypothetical protein